MSDLKSIINTMVTTHCTERTDQVTKFLTYLEDRNFYTAPASAMHHNNFQGGLGLHSASVAKSMIELVTLDTMYKGCVSTESCVITGLFHDVHKCTDGWDNDGYIDNVLKSGKVSDAKPFITNPDLIYLSGPVKSLILISKFISISPEEMQAVLYHDGQYEYANRGVSGKECMLTMLLHHADVWHAFMTEDKL